MTAAHASGRFGSHHADAVATVAFAAVVLLAWQATIASRSAETALLELLGLDDAWQPTAWAACTATLFASAAAGWQLGVLGASPRAAGLTWGQTRRHAKTYAALAGIMVGLALITAWLHAFRAVYPLGGAGGAAWWAAYGGALVATEWFFRGLLLFPLAPALGRSAPLVAVLPYALLHAHKPAPEALGSIVAGVVLGHLALASHSIWGGVAVHVSVAVAMELATRP